jgi:hypothetical protein
MDQNGGALHAATGMLDKDADLTQDLIGYLLRIAQWRVGVLWTLARLLGRDVDPIALVVRLDTEIASIYPDIDICKPSQIWGQLLF